MKFSFDHEKLKVYQRSLQFITWVTPVLDTLPKPAAVTNQLDRASTSITLNIAEGNGKWSSKDRCRFFDISRGSALECAAALDIAVVKGHLASSLANEGKEILLEITKMLVGLIKANDPERSFGEITYLRESGPEMSEQFYLSEEEMEQEQD